MQSWWQENRAEARDLFADEPADGVEQIRRWPTCGTVFASRVDGVVRRVLMPRTKNHVYYTIDGDEIVILSVWGAPRGRPPKL